MLHDTLNLKGRLEIYLHDAKTGKLKEKQEYNNLVVDTGRESIADGLRGETTNNKGIITYGAVGTGTNVPASGDTQLQTEIDRKSIATTSRQENTAIFTIFFNESEANGVLREAGLFGDNATDSQDSGTLFCRTAINRTKSSSDTLTIVWYVTV